MEAVKSRKFLRPMLTDLGWPLFWGLTLWVGFYACLRVGLIDYPLVHRYFTVHPVEYIEAAMFFRWRSGAKSKINSCRPKLRGVAKGASEPNSGWRPTS